MVDEVSARSEADRRFAADVSHELRSPLQTLSAATSVLDRRRDELDERTAPRSSTCSSPRSSASSSSSPTCSSWPSPTGRPSAGRPTSSRCRARCCARAGCPRTCSRSTGGAAVLDVDPRRFEQVLVEPARQREPARRRRGARRAGRRRRPARARGRRRGRRRPGRRARAGVRPVRARPGGERPRRQRGHRAWASRWSRSTCWRTAAPSRCWTGPAAARASASCCRRRPLVRRLPAAAVASCAADRLRRPAGRRPAGLGARREVPFASARARRAPPDPVGQGRVALYFVRDGRVVLQHARRSTRRRRRRELLRDCCSPGRPSRRSRPAPAQRRPDDLDRRARSRSVRAAPRSSRSGRTTRWCARQPLGVRPDRRDARRPGTRAGRPLPARRRATCRCRAGDGSLPDAPLDRDDYAELLSPSADGGPGPSA